MALAPRRSDGRPDDDGTSAAGEFCLATGAFWSNNGFDGAVEFLFDWIFLAGFSIDATFLVEIPLESGDGVSSKGDFGVSVLGTRPHLYLLKRETNSFWLTAPKLLLTAELSTVAGATVDRCCLGFAGFINCFKLAWLGLVAASFWQRTSSTTFSSRSLFSHRSILCVSYLSRSVQKKW